MNRPDLPANADAAIRGAESIRGALLAAAIDAYEDAGLQGICAEGRWEAAVGAMRRVDLAPLLGSSAHQHPLQPRMSRFGPDPQAFFDSVYGDVPPWDIGGSQPAMLALMDEFPPHGRILDLGCGGGDHALALARRGHEVLGVDIVETAIAQAREKASTLPPEIAARLRFEVADALHPSRLGRFGAIVDSGFYHLFDPEEGQLLRRDVAQALTPGGRYYLLAFATEFPIPNVPRAVTQEEVRASFADEDGWRILALRDAMFENRVAPVPATAACIERIRTSSGDAGAAR